MILKNAIIADKDFKLVKADIRIQNGKISEIGESLSDDSVTDFTGNYILPGFVDTHIHGAYG